MEKPITLAIVDDQQLFRAGLISLINEFDKLQVIMEASNGKELIEKIGKQKPDVVLLDIEMPVMDGFEVTDYLKKNHPDIKILNLSTYDDQGIIDYLIGAGSHGFLLKNNNIEVIVDAIHDVMENGYHYNDNVPESMIKGLHGSKKDRPCLNAICLTQREIEVIRSISRGYTNKEIANELGISVKTVDGHRERILYKTKAKNTAGMITYAIKNNLFVIAKN